MSQLLPLFPLELVLFPGMPLPLHIFEPRYKEMIGELLEQKRPFGVVRATKKGVAEIGCSAEIMAVTKRYEDGKLDIVTEGRERFEVMHLEQGRSYLRGEVQFFDDEPAATPKEQVERVLELHRDAMNLLEASGQMPTGEEPQLSFVLAGVLPFDLDFKQTLLGIRSEPERVIGLIEYYQAIMPDLRRAVKARRKSGGNGHVS